MAKPIFVGDDPLKPTNKLAPTSEDQELTPVGGPSVDEALMMLRSAVSAARPAAARARPAQIPATANQTAPALSSPPQPSTTRLNSSASPGAAPHKTKIIAVVGAGNGPGWGLITASFGDKKGEFAIRAITREIESDEGRFLGTIGVEVVTGNVSDEASLRKAFAGAYGAFHILLSSEHPFPDTKLAEAKSVAQAAKHAGLRHVVWATLEDPGQTLLRHDDLTPTFKDGRWVGGPTAENETDKVFRNLGIPTTFLQTSWDPTVAAGKWTEEIGRYAYDILRSREPTGETVSISAGQLSARSAEGIVEAPVPKARRPVRSFAIAAVVAVSLLVVGLVFTRSIGRQKPDSDSSGVQPPVIALAPQAPRSPTQALSPTSRPISPTVEVPEKTRALGLVSADRKQGEPDGMIIAATPGISQSAVTPSSRPPSKRAAEPRRRPGEPASIATEPPVPIPPPREEPAFFHGAPAAGVEATPDREIPVKPAPVLAVALPPADSTRPASLPPPFVKPNPPGFVEPKAVSATVRAHASEAQGCFERAIMERADLHGRLTVRATLNPMGRVISVSTVNAIDGGARLQNCLVTAFTTWMFPPPTGGVNGDITYSFSFK